MSKGSQRRNEDIGKIWDNWDAIFGKKEPVKEQTSDAQLAEPEPPSNDDAK